MSFFHFSLFSSSVSSCFTIILSCLCFFPHTHTRMHTHTHTPVSSWIFFSLISSSVWQLRHKHIKSQRDDVCVCLCVRESHISVHILIIIIIKVPTGSQFVTMVTTRYCRKLFKHILLFPWLPQMRQGGRYRSSGWTLLVHLRGTSRSPESSWSHDPTQTDEPQVVGHAMSAESCNPDKSKWPALTHWLVLLPFTWLVPGTHREFSWGVGGSLNHVVWNNEEKNTIV